MQLLLYLSFLLNITFSICSLSWVKVLSTQLIWSPSAPPTRVTSLKKNKERKLIGLLSVLHAHQHHVLHFQWNTGKGAHTQLGMSLSDSSSRNRILVQCYSNHCRLSPPPLCCVRAYVTGENFASSFRVMFLTKTVNGYEICGRILWHSSIKCPHTHSAGSEAATKHSGPSPPMPAWPTHCNAGDRCTDSEN